jgi:hypothetical protein
MHILVLFVTTQTRLMHNDRMRIHSLIYVYIYVYIYMYIYIYICVCVCVIYGVESCMDVSNLHRATLLHKIVCEMEC